MQTTAGYRLDDDPSRIDVDAVRRFLGTDAYWGRWRGRADVEAQIAHAWRVVGAYSPQGGQVGFARAVSDGVALAYLADVYVLPEHRGRGLGAALVEEMIERGPGARFRWMLHTADAHPLYRRFGFAPADLTYLERPADPTPSTDAWEPAVAAVWAAASGVEEDVTVAAIESLAAQRPGSAESAFELASAYDFAGREPEAEPLYRQALAIGLDDGRRSRAVVQLASTVRNLGRPEESLQLLREPLTGRPAEARAAFAALALVDAGRERDAAVAVLRALAERLPVYGRAVRAYADDLARGQTSDW